MREGGLRGLASQKWKTIRANQLVAIVFDTFQPPMRIQVGCMRAYIRKYDLLVIFWTKIPNSTGVSSRIKRLWIRFPTSMTEPARRRKLPHRRYNTVKVGQGSWTFSNVFFNCQNTDSVGHRVIIATNRKRRDATRNWVRKTFDFVSCVISCRAAWSTGDTSNWLSRIFSAECLTYTPKAERDLRIRASFVTIIYSSSLCTKIEWIVGKLVRNKKVVDKLRNDN